MTITIVLVVLGSSILLSFLHYQRAKSSLITQLEDNYAVAAQKYALELTAWVNTNATIIDTMAAEITVNGISFKEYDEFHNYLKNSNALLNKNGFVYDIYFTYPDNFMVCASDFIADGSIDFVHEREWYTTSALTGELFFAAPYLDSDTQKPIITISKAVYRNDDLLGVLAADIFVDVLVDLIRKADVANNSYAFLIDQSMRMIVHPNKAYDYTEIPLKVMDVPGAPYGSLMTAIQKDDDTMVFVKDYDGVTRGISFAEMPNTGWYVCIATDKDELAAGADSLMSGFVIATTISILICAAIAMFLAHVLDKLNKQEQEYKQEVLKLEKQAADQASEAKSRFLADMSHEIRTPINAIIGMNEMILREADNGEIQEYSRNIKQSGHNLLQLINGILDFSKIEDGKMEIVPVRYNLMSQIAYSMNVISEKARAKNLEMVFNIDPELPTEMYGDETRISQVIMNLLTNAVKYTEKGSVTFTSKVMEKTEDGQVRIYFEIKDTGIGIKESDMARLFESFERLDVVRNRNIEGTGLGMTITRNLLELMGSELKVESEYGVGSVFSFELWQKIEDARPIGDYRKAIEKIFETEGYRESFYAPGVRILVVDDTKMNVKVVVGLLKKTGIKIDTALSGLDAVRAAGENKYDVILMDQRMPGIDGTEAMKQIRAQENGKNKNTPIICLTADVISGARERYLAQGFDDYMMKPVDGMVLEEMLIHYIPAGMIERISVLNSGDDADDPDIPGQQEHNEALMSALENIGVDTKTGLGFCGNDLQIYKSVLCTYSEEASSKREKLEKSYASKDWKEYAIRAHSLKSTSKTIGAMKLSGLAAKLEAAANENDILVIEENHNDAMKMYVRLTEVIKNNTVPGDTGDSKEDDEILEFAPE